jgi:radical SAM protein with 4Fe4S-binding SPASM domain
VLFREAGQVFRFQEQEQFHTMIIDQSLCTEAGKGYYDLVVVGRFGMHRGRYDPIGSNASRVAEQAPVNVLITGKGGGASPSGEAVEPATVPVEWAPALVWTEEARARLEKVPSFARPMALLGALWNDPANPVLEEFRNKTDNLQGACGECRYKMFCGGGCRVRAWYTTGDFLAEDPFCEIVIHSKNDKDR